MSINEITDKQSINQFLSGNRELEELSARLSKFNVFRALGIENAEICHSNTLAWLLDPAESHGLGDAVLRRVVSNILLEAPGLQELSPARVELMDFGDVEVRREEFHIDVLVIDHKNEWVLLLENKIKAGEGKEQLVRYREAIRKQYTGFIVVPVFLTLEGRSAEDQEGAGYIPYSYVQLLGVIKAVFDQRKRQMAEAVSEFLRQYIETLRRLTMQDEELVELCKRIYRKHQTAIDLIVEYGKASCFERVVNDVLKGGGQAEVILSTASQVIFLPNTWVGLVPENGIMWTSKSMTRRVSVGCWFGLNSEGNKVNLTCEITAMNDPKLRLTCINALQRAGFKLGAKAFKEDTKYSRFFNETHRVSDCHDEAEVEKIIVELLTKAEPQFRRAEKALEEAFGQA